MLSPRLHSLAVPSLLSPLLEHGQGPGFHPVTTENGGEGAVDPSASPLAVPLLRALPVASMIHHVHCEEVEGTWVGAQ